MMTLDRSYSYLYVGVIALASWWLVQLADIGETDRLVVPAHSADYFSKVYAKWEMDEQGQLKSKVLADEMKHYSDDGTTHLQKPLIFFHNEKKPPWIIQSETGILSADGNDLWLNGKVTVDRAGAAGVRELKINTSNLKVKPETSYAETVEKAELISPPNWTIGTGMKLVFVEPIHLELLDNVKGKYEKK
ncbi:MAG: LPS export ABC transporter periplasmic protein LptC [Methylococcaceae bacterium]